MKYILAISGGVDSMTLLDMVARRRILADAESLLVAHFDHGIRENSANDVELVKKLAKKYQIESVIGSGYLEKNTSEHQARKKRYEFLRTIASSCKNSSCRIVTAHHQDDLLETVVMNLIRGTGWRGLAPFWADDIVRPIIDMNKAEIIRYAIDNNLEWAEDETNYSEKYFRNRIRDFVVQLPIRQKQQLLRLNAEQTKLRSKIEAISNNYYNRSSISIKAIKCLPELVALEILRQTTGGQLTTPQLKRFLHNISNAKSGDIYQIGGKIQAGIYLDMISFSKYS